MALFFTYSGNQVRQVACDTPHRGVRDEEYRVASSHQGFFDSFFGDLLSSVDSNNSADGGGGTALSNTMSLAFISFPYRLLLASLSGRRVEPEREIPANNPRARE